MNICLKTLFVTCATIILFGCAVSAEKDLSIHAKNNFGKTAIDLAVFKGNSEIANILSAHTD